MGSGEQWVPWVHLADCVNMLRFVLQNDAIHGPVNMTAPIPVRQKELAATLASLAHKPSKLRTPAWALKLALGEGARPLLTGQRVIPQVLLDSGYEWAFSSLKTALQDLIREAG